MWQRQSVVGVHRTPLGVAFALMLSLVSAPCFAQSAESSESKSDAPPESPTDKLRKSMDVMKGQLPTWFLDYQSNGAAMTSVPAEGQPGADFFSHGADATSVSGMGPASAFFTNGEAVTNVGGAAQSNVEYFRNGAQATNVAASGDRVGSFFSNGAEATSVPGPNEIGGDFFSQGATANSVPKPGQPGAEYFSNGAEALSPNLRPKRSPPPPPPEEPNAKPQEAPDASAAAEMPDATVPDAAAQTSNEPAETEAGPQQGTEAAPSEPAPAESEQTFEATHEQQDDEASALPARNQTGSGTPSARNDSSYAHDPESDFRSTLFRALQVFVKSVFGYVSVLVALLSVLIAGVAWRIHRVRARKRLAGAAAHHGV
jgi:hypothetical protein